MDSFRLVIVTGKGGVGRSAVAGALALHAARRGRKVLAISMTTGIGLAEHLGVETLSPDPEEIRSGIYAAQIERPAALDEYLRLQIGVPRFARLGPLARAFDALASTAPGIREIVTMGKVLYEVKTQRWDIVVADGPPSGQIGSHLRAPRTISELVPTGRVREQASWMAEILADEQSSAILPVTLAEELPFAETIETLTWMQQAEMVRLLPVVTNRVIEPLPVSNFEALAPGPVYQAALLHQGVAEEQRRWLDQLPPGPRIPYIFGATGPAEVAERMADQMEAW